MKQKLFNLMVTVCMLLTLLPLSATTIHGADLVSVTFDSNTTNYNSPVMWFDITVVAIGLAITLWKRRKRKA